MSNVVEFKARSATKTKKKLKAKAQAKTLCKNGFHKWEIDQKKQFDVKTGKLVTRYICSRCGQTKTELS